MANSKILSLLLGSLALSANAYNDLEQMPESWCITYLSTYLAPVSVAPSSLPAIESSITLRSSVTLGSSLSQSEPDVTSSALSFASSTDETSPSTTTSARTTGELIVLLVVPDRNDNKRLQRRDLGGFVGSQSEICDDADVFNLVDGQLLEGNTPIYYNGEEFKVFGGQGDVPSSAITRTFTRDGNILRFQSSRIPTGEAGFCQTPSNGQVYITFSSEPAGCVAVRLLIIDVKKCQNGDIVSSTAITSESQQFTSASTMETVVSNPSSSEASTQLSESEPVVVTTRPDGVVTTRSSIPGLLSSSTFIWSNMSSSSQSPPKTSGSSFVPPSTFLSSTLDEPVSIASSTETTVDVSSNLETTEVSTTESTAESSTLVELTSTTEQSTSTILEFTSQSDSQTTTEETSTTTGESTTDISTTTTTEELTTSTSQVTSESDSQTTTAETSTSAEESTTDISSTTAFTSSFDSTTETTSEAATTTTAEPNRQIVCPSNPNQCFNTMEIYCDTVVGGIPLTPGTFTAQTCFEFCFSNPACVIWTHNGNQCFTTTDSNENQGEFSLTGWTSGIRGRC
ncbi:hypothetical protein FSPOR_8244 [Fusarium sporotrichioides]|uniref:DUF7908 domain-containing protein n=1 Tax=Fusarium sporotrichioides TaxID=5514 RepID=A0A395RV65_FUSSP|nr:hypothetical protein FSPOR_8244 [Fusarium sporotrichioides]